MNAEAFSFNSLAKKKTNIHVPLNESYFIRPKRNTNKVAIQYRKGVFMISIDYESDTNKVHIF